MQHHIKKLMKQNFEEAMKNAIDNFTVQEKKGVISAFAIAIEEKSIITSEASPKKPVEI